MSLRVDDRGRSGRSRSRSRTRDRDEDRDTEKKRDRDRDRPSSSVKQSRRAPSPESEEDDDTGRYGAAPPPPPASSSREPAYDDSSRYSTKERKSRRTDEDDFKMPGGFSQDNEPAASSSRKSQRQYWEEEEESNVSRGSGKIDRLSRDAEMPQMPPQSGSYGNKKSARFKEEDDDYGGKKSARFKDEDDDYVNKKSARLKDEDDEYATKKSARFKEEDDEDEDERKMSGMDRLKRDSEQFSSSSFSQPSSTKSKRASVPVPYPEDDHPFMPKYPVDFPPSPMSPTAGSRDPNAKYAPQARYQYASPPDNVSFNAKAYPTSSPPTTMPEPMSPSSSQGHHRSSSYSVPPPPTASKTDSDRGSAYPQTKVVKSPSELSRNDKLERTVSESATSSSNSRARGASLSVNEPKKSALRTPSPSGMDKRMNRLSVSGDRPDFPPGSLPPGSPLLEAYKGTYQSISPIPSPMMLPADLQSLDSGSHGRDDSIDDLAPLSTITTSTSVSSTSAGMVPTKMIEKPKRRVKIYDSETDAAAINKALSHTSGAKPEPIVSVLPGLTHDQILELRNTYKKTYKVAGRGINMTKHIKASTGGQFGKLAYVTSLGKWESEAYWANTWYQSHASSRELLIEALMGRTNADIREVKEAFKDKRYNDDLERALEKELKPDKFRMAVLLALQGKRQEETDTMSSVYRNRDIDYLADALHEDKGGESAMLQIVVTRSDAHLRAVLSAFEAKYKTNFAREALRKSNNLVGETLAHILNGVINRAARDAALLRHAVEDIRSKNRSVELRYELLMSRLVRLHWDRVHLARVKEEYARRFGASLEREVGNLGSGGFGDFCAKLCEV